MNQNITVCEHIHRQKH